ncbi:MAG: diguanylate cyclase [Eubacterium sp.]|nr:diguanylate cyclase [Eubacterium sp.]
MRAKPLILVVDSTRATLRYMESILVDKYYVSFAQSGLEALDAAKAEQPDLIILNVNMSGISGFEVMKELKEDKETEDIPVVLMMDEKDNESEIRGLQEGAMDFITMPFAPEILRTRVEHIIELGFLQRKLEGKIEKQKEQINNMSLQSMMTIAQTVDAKDRYAKGHSIRVALCAKAIAKRLNWNEKETVDLYYTALLHDIGKIAVGDSILNKAGNLTEEEFDAIKQHTTIGAEIVRNTTFIPGVEDGVCYHHEHYDGKGYFGLAGEKIPLAARIIAVADAYEAMSSDRSFRRKLSKERIWEELMLNRGTQFDPHIIDVFMQMLEEGFVIDEKMVERELGTGTELEEAGALLRQVFSENAKETQSELEKDSLTGFLNRRYFEEKVNNYLLKPQATGTFFMMDIDNFKEVNDTYGHAAGDELLLEFAKVLKKNVRENDFVCRIGGDEFAIFFPELDREYVIRQRAESIIGMFTEKKEELGYYCCSVSIGIMTKYASDEEVNCDSLYRDADKALYHVKNNGKDDYHMFVNIPTYVDGGNLAENQLSLNQLVRRIAERKYHQGAYSVEYGRFAYIYQFIARNVERSKQQVQIVLFNMEDKEKKEPEREWLEDSMMLLETAIIRSLRRGDVTTQFSPTQQIVVLMNTNEENGLMVAQRIVKKYDDLAGKKALGVSYEIMEIPFQELEEKQKEELEAAEKSKAVKENA